MTWIWYDGPGAPKKHKDLKLPGKEELPDQGAMFVGEKGRLLLPHFMQLPRLIMNGEFRELDLSILDPKDHPGDMIRDYEKEGNAHYHQFVDACLGKAQCSAPFSYAARLTETILLGVIAGRFPGKTLHWDRDKAQFAEAEANAFLDAPYRDF
jgi:hypothetical protein